MTSNPSATDNVFRPALLCIMVGCVLLSLVSLIQVFVPGWDGTMLIAFDVLAAAEAYISFQIFRRDNVYRFDSGRILLIELAGLYCLLQLCIDVVDGSRPFQDYFPHLDGKTVGLFAIVLLTWLLVTETARDLDHLTRPTENRIDFVPPERRLATRFFGGGVLLFVLSGLTQVHIAEAIKLPTPATSGPVINVLVYFLLGMVFLGHIHYASLRGRWRREDISVVGGLGNSWVRYTLGFVGLVALVAWLLPTGHTVGLLDVGRAIWTPISTALIQIILTVKGPLTWLLRLFGGKAPVTRPRVIPPHLPHHLPIPHLHHSTARHALGGGGAITLLKSLLFWVLLLAVSVYLLRTFRPRGAVKIPVIGGMLAAMGGVLAKAWSSFLARLRGYMATVIEHVPRPRILDVVPSITPRTRRPFRRVASLPAREQVIYFYLSAVRHARRQGFTRRGSQTPREFSTHLAPHLNEAGNDMDALTDAFVEARYSRHDLPVSQVGRARSSWQRVKAALREAYNREHAQTKQ